MASTTRDSKLKFASDYFAAIAVRFNISGRWLDLARRSQKLFNREKQMGALKSILVSASISCAMSSAVAAPAPEEAGFIGIWITDQRDGAVEINLCGDRLCGYIYAIFRVPDPTRPIVDARNEDPQLRLRPLCGLQVLKDLKKISHHIWGDGQIYDPHIGKTFGANITLNNRDTLEVHGYLLVNFIGRTVHWTRARSGLPRCSPPKT